MEKTTEKMKPISPVFTEEERKEIRILAAKDGQSMRVWLRAEALKLVAKSKEK